MNHHWESVTNILNLRLKGTSIKSKPMKNQLSQHLRILITAVVTVLVWGHVAWDYAHEGIPVHHIFHSAAMPGMPNWWGAIVLPFFTYF